MDYNPQDGHGLRYDPFNSCTVPRPIGWISTRSADGIDNLAPFSHWQNVMKDPPMVMFSALQSPLGGRKDTVRNVEQTGWFVWNMATSALRQAVNVSGQVLPPDVDEFDLAGVTKAASVLCDIPRVAESPCHFECRHLQTIRIPAANGGAADLVIGQVERIHLADEIIRPDGRLDIETIKPLARMGYYDYAVVESVFEMMPPAVAAAGPTTIRSRTEV